MRANRPHGRGRSRRASMSKYVGQRVKRTEDPRLIKGLAHYVDDVGLPETLHVVFVRSLYAHARITGVDANEPSKPRAGVAGTPAKTVAEKPAPGPCGRVVPVW